MAKGYGWALGFLCVIAAGGIFYALRPGPTVDASTSIRTYDLPGCYASAISPTGNWVGITCHNAVPRVALISEFPKSRAIKTTVGNKGTYAPWSVASIDDEGMASLTHHTGPGKGSPYLSKRGDKPFPLPGWPKGQSGWLKQVNLRGHMIGNRGISSSLTSPGTPIEGLLRDPQGRLTTLPFDRSVYDHAFPMSVSLDGKTIHGELRKGMNTCVAVWKDGDMPRALTPLGWGRSDVTATPDGSVLFVPGEKGILVLRDEKIVQTIDNPPVPPTDTRPRGIGPDGFVLMPLPPSSSLDVIGCRADGRLLVGTAHSSRGTSHLYLWLDGYGRFDFEPFLRRDNPSLAWERLQISKMDQLGQRIAGSVSRKRKSYPVVVDFTVHEP